MLRGSHIDVKEPPPSQIPHFFSPMQLLLALLQMLGHCSCIGSEATVQSQPVETLCSDEGSDAIRRPQSTSNQPLPLLFSLLFSLVAEWEAGGSTLNFGKGR